MDRLSVGQIKEWIDGDKDRFRDGQNDTNNRNCEVMDIQMVEQIDKRTHFWIYFDMYRMDRLFQKQNKSNQ